jgi:alpha-glucosidase
VLARKDRASENWYLGAASDESGRLINVPLNFLEPNKSYLAQIYRDADDAHYLNNPQAIAIEQITLRATDTLAIRLAPGGGMTVRFLEQ